MTWPGIDSFQSSRPYRSTILGKIASIGDDVATSAGSDGHQIHRQPDEVEGEGPMSVFAPGVERTTVRGTYPFAEIEYQDEKLPVAVSLEAYSPFVPLDAEASGLPAIVMDKPSLPEHHPGAG